MKALSLFLVISATTASAQKSPYVNFVRQTQQGTGVMWDMPVAAVGAAPSALALEAGGSLFQLWTIEKSIPQDYLLDQKLVGAYLPKADVVITTLDPHAGVTRTRIDQPFTVEIQVSDLLSGSGLPRASSEVLLERHIASYLPGQASLDPTVVTGGVPISSAVISQNGKTFLKFPASILKAADPTKALGEEHFIIHALSDTAISQSQIASAKVQVWPIASGAILGLTPGMQYRLKLPAVKIQLTDLYPRSDTYFMLYEGTQINGIPGRLVKSFPVTRDRTVSDMLDVPELDTMFTQDGTYTVGLMSTTVYGTELLCPPVTFSVKRSMSVNVMQMSISDGIVEP